MNFGEIIRELRQEAFKKDRGKNIDSISKFLNISRGHLMNVERGDRQPFGEDLIQSFCEFIGKTDKINDLLEASIASRDNLVFDLKGANENQRRQALKLAREWSKL